MPEALRQYCRRSLLPFAAAVRCWWQMRGTSVAGSAVLPSRIVYSVLA